MRCKVENSGVPTVGQGECPLNFEGPNSSKGKTLTRPEGGRNRIGDTMGAKGHFMAVKILAHSKILTPPLNSHLGTPLVENMLHAQKMHQRSFNAT